MAKYESGDMVTYYFVYVQNDGSLGPTICAWSDNKKLIDFYLTFHNCKSMRVKKMTDTIDAISMILEENCHDEICIANFTIRGDTGRDTRMVYVPITENELNLVNEECNTFFASNVHYYILNMAYYYFKKKYRNALEKIFLKSVMHHVIHNKADGYTQQIDLDQMRLLIKCCSDRFG